MLIPTLKFYASLRVDSLYGNSKGLSDLSSCSLSIDGICDRKQQLFDYSFQNAAFMIFFPVFYIVSFEFREMLDLTNFYMNSLSSGLILTV